MPLRNSENFVYLKTYGGYAHLENELANGVSMSLLLGAGFFLWKKYASSYVLWYL